MENNGNNQQIVNTDLAKEKVNASVGKAKNVAINFVGRLQTDRRLMIGTIVVVVLVLLILFGKFLDPGYRVANSYMNASKKMDAEKIVELAHEDFYEDEDDAVNLLEDVFDELEDEDYVITSYKIRECEKYSDDELDDLAERIEEKYDIDEKDVQAAKTYHIRINSKEDDEKDIDYTSVTVVKIDGKWYYYG